MPGCCSCSSGQFAAEFTAALRLQEVMGPSAAASEGLCLAVSSLGTVKELPCGCRKAHARLPQLLTVSIWTHPGSNPKEWQGSGSVSRSCALRRPEAGVIADDATQLVKAGLDVVRCQGRLRKNSVAMSVEKRRGAVNLRL